jgi:hypothetical protein
VKVNNSKEEKIKEKKDIENSNKGHA